MTSIKNTEHFTAFTDIRKAKTQKLTLKSVAARGDGQTKWKMLKTSRSEIWDLVPCMHQVIMNSEKVQSREQNRILGSRFKLTCLTCSPGCYGLCPRVEQLTVQIQHLIDIYLKHSN